MGEGSPPLAREAPPSRPYPYLSGLSAHRVIDLIALQVAPAATATAIAYSHLDSDWRATLIFFSFFGVSMLLRRGEHPSHLIPFAWATLYALAPPIAALVAWVVTGVGALLTHRFRHQREVRIGVIGSHEFARGLEAELDAV